MAKKRVGRRRKVLLGIGLSLLFSLGVAYIIFGPHGVTRLRTQNSIFSVQRIEVEDGEDGILYVTQTIQAKNLYPWPVTFAQVGHHSKGEYSVLWRGNIFTALPLTLAPWENREISLTYPFHADYFLEEYASGWQREQGAPPDPAACIKDFLSSDNFIFYSEDVPGKMAYSFTVNCNPVYINQSKYQYSADSSITA